MKLLRSFPLLSFALVLLGIVGLCVAQRSVGLLLVAGALAVTSWYVTEGPRGRSLPRWVSNVLVLAVCLNVVVDLVMALVQGHDDLIGVLGRFTVWLTLIKLYERRTPRDYAHLLILSLLLILTGCLQSSELLFGAILLIYAVLGLYVLLLFQLYAANERTRSQRTRSIPARSWLVPPSKPVIGRQVGLQFRGLVLGVGLAGVLLSAVLFVMFPRGWGEGVVSTLAPAAGRRVGFSPDVNLLGSTRITESRALVMDVRVLDDRGRPVRPTEPLLLRGGVLGRYDGGRWRADDTADSVRVLAPRTPLADVPPEESAGALTIQVELHTSTDTVFVPYAAIDLATEGVDHVNYDRTTQLLSVPAGAGRLLRYDVRSDLDPSDDVVAQLAERRPPRLMGRDRYSNEQVGALTRRLLDEADLAPPRRIDGSAAYWTWSRRAAAHLEAYLRSSTFTYTTESGIVYERDRDPVEQFLTRVRRGHCEFFASALAAMCQNVDINARLVTGYVAWEYDETQQLYVVLASNAHAWVEVATGPNRWTTFDPTPPATLRELHAGAATFADHLRWIYQGLEGGWSSRIVEFDRKTQTSLVAKLDRGWSQRLAGGLDAARSWLRRVNRAFNLGPAGYIWMGIVVLALVIAIIALVKLMRRTRRLRLVLRLGNVRGAEYQRLLRQLGFYLDMLRLLERGGCPKPAWMPPQHYAGQLESHRPVAAGLVYEVTGLFYEARYGGRRLSSSEQTRARSLVEQLGRRLKGPE